MITENLSTLKINKLTKAQYERELEAGRIDPNALYLTLDEAVVFPTPYGVCSTAATNVAKEVTVNGDFILETGARVLVNFA